MDASQAAPGRRAQRARRGHVTFQSKDMSGARIWIETKRAEKRPLRENPIKAFSGNIDLRGWYWY